MPYLITFASWPGHKSVEVIKKTYEVLKKFPEDKSLGENLTPGNALKGTKEGFQSITVQKINKGKLEEAYSRSIGVVNFYAMAIEGFDYKVEIWSTNDEAYGSIGQKPPK